LKLLFVILFLEWDTSWMCLQFRYIEKL
jgi:hypothetical protein